MEKNIVEKAVDGKLFENIYDVKYFYIIMSFGLYLDFYLSFVFNSNLRNINYKAGDNLYIGDTIILITSFSLLVAVIVPILFHIMNSLYWEIWFATPLSNIFYTEKNYKKYFSDYISISKLKSWAIENDNSSAMELVKNEEKNEINIRKIRLY